MVKIQAKIWLGIVNQDIFLPLARFQQGKELLKGVFHVALRWFGHCISFTWRFFIGRTLDWLLPLSP